MIGWKAGRGLALVMAAVWAVGCGGGTLVNPNADAGAGLVLSGAVALPSASGGTVTAYAVTAGGGQGAALGTCAVDAQGQFTLALPPTAPPLLLVASRTRYAEPAVPDAGTSLGAGEDLSLLVTRLDADAPPTELRIGPVSEWADALTRARVRAGQPLEAASAAAWADLDAHFGALDWGTATPRSLSSGAPVTLDDDGRAGVLLAGLSMQARTISENAGRTPGTTVTLATLVHALSDDLAADGLFDGQGPSGTWLLPRGASLSPNAPTATRGDGQTVRFALANAASAFLRSRLNATELTASDAQGFLSAMASDENPALFAPGLGASGTGPAIDWTTTFDVGDGHAHPPVGDLAWVAGRVTVIVRASSPNALASLALSRDGQALEPKQGSALPAELHASVDTHALADGKASFTVTAADARGNVSAQTFSVTVANHLAPAQLTLRAVAGEPAARARVRVQAVDRQTGAVDPAFPPLGEGVTDEHGAASLALTTTPYLGPIRVTVEPTEPVLDPTDEATRIAWPQGLVLTSTQGRWETGQPVVLGATLWTTLADVAAAAYAAGHHRLFSGAHPYDGALAWADPLFAAHVRPEPAWSLRQALPAVLTEGQATLAEPVLASLPDTALAQLARWFSGSGAGATNGNANVVNALTLTVALEEDLRADGQFDGRGEGGRSLNVGGSASATLEANTLRASLAQALDAFVEGAHNRTGLRRADLATAGIDDALALDVAALFGPQAPVPFDATPPRVAVSVAFLGGDGKQRTADASGRVAGRLRIEIAATDAAGIQRVAASLRGMPLVPDSNDGAGHLVFSWDSRTASDGAVDLAIVATDGVGNAGSTTLHLVVDNTPPSVASAAPAAGWYSAAVPLDARATDAAGMASLTVEGAPGFADADSAVDHLVGDWPLPSSVVDGPLTGVRLQACDPVGNCLEVPVEGVQVDRQPPAVSVLQAPRFSNGQSIALTVAASDGATGSGVAAVHAQASAGAAVVDGVFDGQAWQFPSVPVSPGQNTIAVWADDGALPANSGKDSSSSAAKVMVPILIDVTPPNPTLVPGVPSHLDERALGVKTTDGVPVVPVEVTWPAGAAKVPVDLDHPVYKTSPRLSWGPTPPTGAQLEGSNPFNTPFVQVQLPLNPGADAPLTSVTYAVTVTCDGCAPVTNTGTLIPSARVDPAGQNVWYDLPLAQESLPALATAASFPVSLSITVFATDAAGNSIANGFRPSALQGLAFHVIGPPVVWKEDTDYPSEGDPRSIHPYHLSDVSYPGLWTGDNRGELARVKRYVVYNPWEDAAALSIELTGSWSVPETWDRSVWTLPQSGSERVDGRFLPLRPSWVSDSECPELVEDSYPCDAPAPDFPEHLSGNTATDFTCAALPALKSGPVAPEAAAAGSQLLHSQWVLGNWGQPLPTLPTATGARWLLPGASYGRAGAAEVYVGRPWQAGPRPELTPQTLGNPSGVARDYRWEGDFWTQVEMERHRCPGDLHSDDSRVYSLGTYQASRAARVLTAARESLEGSVMVTTASVRNGAVPTEPSLVASEAIHQLVAH